MHPDVIEDAPGKCPRCRMPLVRVRLVSVWTCPVHGSIADQQPGTCRICGRDLVQVAKALTFTCVGHPEMDEISPGRCPDGTPRLRKYAPRPHGDHNPKHGGVFFMAADNWHHVEGTFAPSGRFRLYIYDDFTRPLRQVDARRIRARVESGDSKTVLTWSTAGGFFQGRVLPHPPPVSITAFVSFMPSSPASRFDFVFASPSPAESSTSRGQIRSGTIAASLTQLKQRDQDIAQLIRDGRYNAVYIPAFEAKDLALQIDAQESGSPIGRREAIERQVKAIVAAAYRLDDFGDIGDRQKLDRAYQEFSDAVRELEAMLR